MVLAVAGGSGLALTGAAEAMLPPWPATLLLGVLASSCLAQRSLDAHVGAVAAALESELISGALSDATKTLHVPPVFMGVVVLALVGTVSDLVSSVWFARQNKLGLVMSICIGSAIQVALVVAPLLVILSWLMGKPMTLVFTNPVDLFAIAGTALIVGSIAGDGETTWFEGVMLIGVYILLAAAYFFT